MHGVSMSIGSTDEIDFSYLAKVKALGEAIAMAVGGGRSARQQAKVFRWFRTWIREGLFQSLKT